MKGKYLEIAGFGLIGEDRKKGPFRQVIFKDRETDESAELTVYEHEKPSIWHDIEKLEQGRTIPPYRGSIVRYKLMNLIILDDESPEQAFEKHKASLKIKNKINYNEAERLRSETLGYVTDLTFSGALEINWKPVDINAALIKFRQYDGPGFFSWTNWYEIID